MRATDVAVAALEPSDLLQNNNIKTATLQIGPIFFPNIEDILTTKLFKRYCIEMGRQDPRDRSVGNS